MREKLAILPQNLYAENGAKPMNDLGEMTAAMESFLSQAAANKAEMAAQAEKEAAAAAAKAAEEKMKKLLQKEQEEKEKAKKKEAKALEKKEEGKKEEAVSSTKIERYFPDKIPQTAIKEAQAFSEIAGGRPLSEIQNTTLITEYYIRLRGQAEEAGADVSFLKEFKQELTIRGVDADGAYESSTQYYKQLLIRESKRLEEEKTLSPEVTAQKLLVEDELKKQEKILDAIATSKLKEEWKSEFTEEELKDPDTRSAIAAAIELKLHPSSVTSKRSEVKQTAEEVVRTSLLEDKETREKTQNLLKKEKLSEEDQEEILKAHEQRLKKAKELLRDENLSKEKQMAIIKAHYTGSGGVYSYSVEDLLKKGRILKEADFSDKERDTLIEAGIAAAPIPAPPGPVLPPDLGRILTGINTEATRLEHPTSRELHSDYLIEQRQRIQELIDRPVGVPGALTAAEADQAQTLINSINERLDNAIRRERVEERRREGSSIKIPLQTEDVADLDPARFTQARISTIAQQVKDSGERRPGAPSGTTDFLEEKIKELSDILNDPGLRPDDPIIPEAQSLSAILRGYKNTLYGRENKERLIHQGDYSNYGEMKLRAPEKARLVELALHANSDPDSGVEYQNWREIEALLNQRITIVDSRSDVDWREALQTAGQIELDDLARTLTNVASGRITITATDRVTGAPIERLVDANEAERIISVARMIDQELVTREYLHNLNYAVNGNLGMEELTKFAGQFSTERADVAFRKKGVAAAFRLYEQAMFQVMTENGWYLPAKAMKYDLSGNLGRVEQLVLEQLQMAQATGAIDKMEDWEQKRAIAIARGMGIITGRFFEIAAQGGIPKGQLLVGWWANSIVNKFAFFRQLARYEVGKERLAVLNYKIENPTRFWHTKELTDILKYGNKEVLNRFVNDDGDSRYIDMVNPMRFGSLFTQTGWRWTHDKVNHAGAIAALLEGGDKDENPIIGMGLWLEKLRNDLINPKTRKAAEARVRRQIALGIEVTPLKFFYNNVGLRQRVFRGSDRPGAINPLLTRLYGRDCINEKDEKGELHPGQIVIKSKDLKSDLQVLAQIQEKLLKKRIDHYRAYLTAKEKGDHPIRPDFFSAEYRTFDYSGIDPTQAERVRQLAAEITNRFKGGTTGHTLMDRFITTLEEKRWKVPYVFGADDIPAEIYDFVETGDESFKRRWGDISSAVSAQDLFHKEILMKMPSFTSREEIVKAMFDVYLALKGHDENVAREFMLRLSEGIIKFYKKDILTRLPAGFGTAKGMLPLIGGKASYAQIIAGRDAMAWDEIEIDSFIKDMRKLKLISDVDIEVLRKRTGAKKWILGFAIARTAIPLSFLALIYMLFSAELKDIFKSSS